MFEYPKKMAEDKYAWIWKPKYYRLMKKKQQFNSVICGRTGSGKSWLSLSVAELFNPNFKPSESVCFSALDFANRVADYSLKKGDVIILDDAGLSAMSGDAMTREVKAIGKIFQSIRHRSLVILLTVPSLQSLAKSARVNSDYYMEPQRWDVRSNRTVCKFQHYSHSPITGKAYRSNHIKAYKKLNPITGFTESVKEKMLSISVPLASEHITKEYDAFKKKRMKEFDVGIADMLTREKDKTTAKGLSNKEIVAKIKRKRDDFVLDGKVSHVKVMEEFNCGDAKARNLAKLANLS